MRVLLRQVILIEPLMTK